MQFIDIVNFICNAVVVSRWFPAGFPLVSRWRGTGREPD
jgi:hypothetical protein